MALIDLTSLTEIEELQARLNLYEEAKNYLEAFKWCRKVLKAWFDFGLYDKIGVFLFEIEPLGSDVDDHIWVIVGDLPPVYLDKAVKNGQEALKVYCELMEEWADNVLGGISVEECYPVEVERTRENAELLKKRVGFLRENLLVAKE